ncbi:MAG: PAS domain S-box protein, partial [Desulfobacteraceae bacterium]|nr:PAS domain S-box protein [Desulfobacteraceae bacterium]
MAEKPTYEELERRVQELEKIESEYKASKELLWNSEAQHQLLFEHADIGIFIAQNGYLKVPNPYLSQLLGYSLAELDEQPFSLFIHPEYHSLVNTRHQERLNGKNGLPQTYDFHVITKTGTSLWVQLSTVLIQFNGRPATLNFLHDITERKSMEEALRESEKKYSDLVHSMGDWIWTINIDGIHTFSNGIIEQSLGYGPDEVINNSAFHLMHPDSRFLAKAALLKSMKKRKGWTDLELTWLHKDGSTRILKSTAHPNFDTDGNLIGFSGVDRDITKQKIAEIALKENEEKYQSLFENAQVALFRNRTSDGKVLEINERYAKMAGYSNKKDCMAEFNAADAWVDQNGRNKLLRLLQKNRFVSDYETQIIRKDGTNIWISFSAMIFPEQGFLEGSIIEITERKRSEIEREKLQTQLVQAQKMESVGRLAGGVAHDFNNMLGVILGHTELALLRTDDKHKLCSDLNEIQKAAKRSADITKQLLAFARKDIISPKQIDLNDTVESMLNMLRRLIGEDIDLVWQPGAHLWPVKMDPTQIDQILANLC